MAGLIVLVVFALLALAAPLVAPFDPLKQDLYGKLGPPAWLSGGSKGHLLGTDDFGRDIVSRIVFGARISLAVGFLSVLISFLIGVPIGLVAGYRRGVADDLLMRFMDILLAFPSILLAIVIVATLGPSLANAMAAVGIVGIPQFARVTRGAVLAEREKEYVEAARAVGCGNTRIMFVTLLPNCMAPLLVQTTLGLAFAILQAAALSFLGLGAQPPTPEWGAMLFEGKNYFYNGWWLMVFPGIAIFLTVLGFNLLGDGLRDALDPRLRGTT